MPAWADQAAISRAQRFEQIHAIEEGITAALHTTIGRVRMPMEMSAIDRAVDLNNPELFADKAAQLLVGFYQAEPFGSSSNLLVDLLKTRMMHSAVRHLLQADHWDHARWGTPINQITFLQNWTMFTNAAYDTLPKFGTTMRPRNRPTTCTCGASTERCWACRSTSCRPPSKTRSTSPRSSSST